MDSDTRKRITRAGGIVRWLKRAAGRASRTSSGVNCPTAHTSHKKLTADQIKSLRAKINHLEKLTTELHSSDHALQIPDTLLRDLKETIQGQQEFAVSASLAIHDVMDSVPQSANYSGLAHLLDQIQDKLQPIVAPSYDKPSKSRLLGAELDLLWSLPLQYLSRQTRNARPRQAFRHGDQASATLVAEREGRSQGKVLYTLGRRRYLSFLHAKL
ncbi:hypothetical protein HII31_00304 [Pseudocercospora fuligena]|uniref:Uncharacterized protein n=1 Tax=Pseudocercospora fuligena TaxID=685502 RepID=A0A8H6VNP7_9PEZI|nr:hypothetical protein HII31_00304 [Pseudocercospora fuligena]